MAKSKVNSSRAAAQVAFETGKSSASTSKISIGSETTKTRDSGYSGSFDAVIEHKTNPKASGPRLARFLPVHVAPASPATPELGADKSASKAEVTSLLEQQSSGSHAAAVKTPKHVMYHVSLYNGPQVAEPCVDGALLHVLQPCGHRVITREPQPCGENCKGNHALFANSKEISDKFACAVCISTYVREHYNAKKGLFVPSLDHFERALGGLEPGWKEQRLARMERIWKNDALEEQLALEALGRYCEVICTSPEDEALVVVDKALPSKGPSPPTPAAISIPSTLPKSKTGRLPAPVPKKTTPKKSHLPTPSHVTPGKKTLEGEGSKERRSRLPVGPRRPRL